MRRIWIAMAAAAIWPLAGKLSAGMANLHVATFRPGRDVLRVVRSKSAEGETFSAMLGGAKPRLAFNGTYYGAEGRPLGLLRSGGKWVFRNGHMRTVFVVDGRGRAAVVARADVRKEPDRYPFAVAAGPRLLTGGRITLNPEAEGFRAASRTIRAPRVALGVRRDGTGVVVVRDDYVTLSEFAEDCREAGAVDAVNLDGGGAAAFYENGKMVVTPRSPMVNVITVSAK